MSFRFCNLCINKPVDLSVQVVHRHFATKASSARSQKQNSVNQTAPKSSLVPSENDVPIIKCKRQEFNFYVGQQYRPRERIALASGGWEHSKSKGDYFTIFPVNAIDNIEEDRVRFKDLPLINSIVDALHQNGLETAMHMQAKAIPLILSGHNTILAAETGCGKTFAYLLPMLHQVLCCKNVKPTEYNKPWGLIVTPTRELAVQITKVAEHLGRHLDIKVKSITGGGINKMLHNPPVGQVDILVSSFGAFQKCQQFGIYKLDRIKHVVLDEADALFHEAFHDSVRSFLKLLPLENDNSTDDVGLPVRTQLTLASATVPARIEQVLSDFVDVSQMEQISTEKLHHVLVRQQFLRITKSTKSMELLKFIKRRIVKRQPVIVFANKSETCDFVNIFLAEHNINSIVVHGTMQWKYRKGKINNFLNGQSLILATTNAASRGLDTTIAKHILNYDFPSETTEYIHRCGRTGRPSMNIEECKVTNFIATQRDVHLTQKIEMAIRKGKPIPIIKLDRSYLLEEEMPLIEQEYDDEENDIAEDKIYEDIEEEGSIPY